MKNQRCCYSIFFISSLILSSFSLLNICIAASHERSEVEDEHLFSYREEKGKGPTKWQEIMSNWTVCGIGKLQSPIDIVDRDVHVLPNLDKFRRNYKPAPATAVNRGHDIMITWEGGDAGSININGIDYKLIQGHWHAPSEHKINGIRYDAEIHFVHQNSVGKLAVVALLFKYGLPDPFLSQVVHHIKPLEPNHQQQLGIINPGELKFGSRQYYRYIGSLTVPPCTEGVVWTVFKKVKTVSMEQISILKGAVHDGFQENSRPAQNLHGRQIQLFVPTRK